MNLRKSLLAIFTAVIVLTVFSFSGAAQSEPEEIVRKLKVSYRAQQKFKPEVAVLNLAVETRNKELYQAYNDNSHISQRVKHRLKAVNGVEIISTSYQVRQERSYQEKKEELYVVNNKIRLETRNLDKLGEIIKRSVQAGANRITGINYKLANYDETYNQVMAKALAGVKKKAEFAAEKMNLELGKAIEIQIDRDNNYRVRADGGRVETAAKSSAEPVITPEKIEIQVNVRAVYQLK